ncbi:MAG: response regulator [Anaerolineae bacterium]|nr:response regulator [Anaerolineae bacterium]MDW8298742.1 response regulator [Anaerolineae bacterium]
MNDWQDITTWRVLIVDDETTNRDVFAETLLYFGAQVVKASNGVEALAHIRQQAPTIILTDLAMPKMDGWELLRTLRADPQTRHIPILAITAAYTLPGDRERVLEAGFDGYLAKPVEVSAFADVLRETIAKARQRGAV